MRAPAPGILRPLHGIRLSNRPVWVRSLRHFTQGLSWCAHKTHSDAVERYFSHRVVAQTLANKPIWPPHFAKISPNNRSGASLPTTSTGNLHFLLSGEEPGIAHRAHTASPTNS